MAAAGAKAQSHAVPNGTASHPEHAAAGAVAAQASHHHHHHHHHHHADTNAKAPTSKKPAAKKPADPSETSKLLAAKISQLESDRAGEKDLEAEIEREVKRANRDLSSLLSTIESPLSRLEIVQKKYTDLLADLRRLEREHAKSKKRAEQLQKERDAGRTELSKMVAMKEKMEKLSRELQKEKQKLKEENKRLEETEQRKREQLNDKMDAMLWEIQEVVNQKEDPGAQSLDARTEELFKSRFKTLIDQYELREQIFAHTLRKKEMEVQANMARFENEKKAAEQEVTRSRDLRVQVATFSQTETELRSQLNVYVEKFKQVEDTLNNSNDLFLTFRKEMEDMSRKTKRLEKENLTLIRKQDLTNRNILEMAEERTRMTKEMDLLKKKNANLEKLCRGMQAQGRGVAAMAAANVATAASSATSAANTATNPMTALASSASSAISAATAAAAAAEAAAADAEAAATRARGSLAAISHRGSVDSGGGGGGGGDADNENGRTESEYEYDDEDEEDGEEEEDEDVEEDDVDDDEDDDVDDVVGAVTGDVRASSNHTNSSGKVAVVVSSKAAEHAKIAPMYGPPPPPTARTLQSFANGLAKGAAAAARGRAH